MKSLRLLRSGAGAVRPLVNAVRGAEAIAAKNSTLTVMDGAPGVTARLRAILGLTGSAPNSSDDGPLLLAVTDGYDPTLQVAALAGAKRSGRRVIVLVIGGPRQRQSLEQTVLAHRPLELSNVAHMVTLTDVDVVLHTIARVLGPDGVPIARHVPALREAVADNLVAQISRQAGTIGAAVMVPGADMPVITILQVRMVMQLAVIYGRPLDARRGLEIAGVLAGAIGWRALARRVVAGVPVAGFALRAGVAFSGTRAVGEAAKTYFATLGERADVPLDGLADALKRGARRAQKDIDENTNSGVGRSLRNPRGDHRGRSSQ